MNKQINTSSNPYLIIAIIGLAILVGGYFLLRDEYERVPAPELELVPKKEITVTATEFSFSPPNNDIKGGGVGNNKLQK